MKIVITGSGGRLGAALMREYARHFDLTGFNHSQLDLSDLAAIRSTLEPLEFDLLINAAAFTNVDGAERERELAFLVNAEAPGVLADVCRNKDAKLIHFSTDYVFDGQKTAAYAESDTPNPINAYGESKLAGEDAVLSVDPRHLVVRVSWVFGPDRPSFIDQIIQRARECEQIAAVADKWSSPSYTRDIAQLLGGTVLKDSSGILHVANVGQCTWQQYAQHAIDCCRRAGVALKADTVDAVTMNDMKTWIARRPVHSVLATNKVAELTGIQPRPWQMALEEYVREFIT